MKALLLLLIACGGTDQPPPKQYDPCTYVQANEKVCTNHVVLQCLIIHNAPNNPQLDGKALWLNVADC